MAAGDTINGSVRYVKQNQLGDALIVAGPFSQTELDQDTFNQKLFINCQAGVDLPFGGANNKAAPEAVFQPGELLIVQHKSASLAEAIDVGDDEFMISIIERDLNTGIVQGRTLGVSDNEITSDPTSSTTAFVSFFQDTVPDRVRWMLRGHQKAAATETA